MYRKTVLFLVFIIIIPLSAENLAVSNLNLKLDFDYAAYYYFGFSMGPVNANNDVTPVPSDGFELYTAVDDGSGYIKTNLGAAHVFWNVVSTQPVTLQLSIGSPLYPIDESGNPITNVDGIDWHIEWDTGKLSSLDKMGPVDFVTINGQEADGGTTTSMLSSKQITISTESIPLSDLSQMIASSYNAQLILEVKAN